MKNWEKGRKVKIKNQVVRFKYHKNVTRNRTIRQRYDCVHRLPNERKESYFGRVTAQHGGYLSS